MIKYTLLLLLTMWSVYNIQHAYFNTYYECVNIFELASYRIVKIKCIYDCTVFSTWLNS
jgi:hypothetical protein